MSENGKFLNETPIIDELEKGPWPSFVTGIKKYATQKKNTMLRGVLDQLEYSYKTRLGYWKGGTVGVKGYGAGVISRFSMIADKFPEAREFHTVRVQPSPAFHYTADELRKLCDSWEKHGGSGLMTMHGQTGNLQFVGIDEKGVQPFFDEINKDGWDLGGAGATVRTGNSCIGAARCEHACYDNLNLMDKIMSHMTDYVHRPELPYKMKFKFSACPNDCNNSIQRSDIATIGIWRDAIIVDDAAVKTYIDELGADYIVNNVIARCPTNAIKMKGNDGIEIDNSSCVHCMHCLNVMTKALHVGKEKGACMLVGGKGHLKVGNMLGVMMIPFMKLETEEDVNHYISIIDRMMDWWSEVALDHERIGETIERVGIQEFLEAAGIEANIDMVMSPRDNPFFKADY